MQTHSHTALLRSVTIEQSSPRGERICASNFDARTETRSKTFFSLHGSVRFLPVHFTIISSASQQLIKWVYSLIGLHNVDLARRTRSNVKVAARTNSILGFGFGTGAESLHCCSS